MGASPNRCAAILAALMLVGCAERGPMAPSAGPPPSGWVVSLEVPARAPAPGTLVEVSGLAVADVSGRALGSFRARVSFDASQLAFVGAEPGRGGALAANASGDAVQLAGAAGAGFADGRLFVLRFRVEGSHPWAGLSLVVREANGSDFSSVLPHLSVGSILPRQAAP